MNSTRESEVQSTQQLRWEKLVSALAEDVWVADAQGLTAEVIAGGDSHVLPAASMPIMERMEAIHPDDREQVLGEVMKTIMLGQPMKVEARVQTKHGYEYREILATPVRDEAGTVIEWVGCNRDIHDRRVAEMKLRRDNLFLELLSEAVQQLLRSQDPARTMQELFARFGERLELDAFAILEIDRDTGKLKLADMAAVPADVAQRLSTLTIHHPVIADCIEARSCQQLDGGCPEASEAFPELCHWGAKSCLLLPLVVDDRLHSLLWLVSKRKEAFDEEEVSVFETLSRNIAATLQRVAMEARIQQQHHSIGRRSSAKKVG